MSAELENLNFKNLLKPPNLSFIFSFQSPDGKYVASGAIDGIINVFDVSSAKLLHTLEGHAMQIRSLTFSPDSQRLLTGSDDGQMKIYDV